MLAHIWPSVARFCMIEYGAMIVTTGFSISGHMFGVCTSLHSPATAEESEDYKLPLLRTPTGYGLRGINTCYGGRV